MPLMQPDEYGYHQTMKTFASAPEPAFETADELRAVWGEAWGCPNDVGRLRAVLVCRPPDDIAIVDREKWDDELGCYADRQAGWYWRGKEAPDLVRMRAQHDSLVALLRREGVRVEYVGDTQPGKFKATSTRDQLVAVAGGAIICRMGAPIRRGEEGPVLRKVGSLGMPVLRTIHGTGIFEGGSFAFLNERTAVVGIGSRVNEEGARQVEDVLRVQGVELLRVQLNGYRQHIDGALVMLDVDTALVNPVGLPFWFIGKLRELGIRTIEVHHEDDFFTVNCLAVRPGRVIMSLTSKRTLDRLDKTGIEVLPLEFDAVYAGGGGIHCSTAPLIRDRI